MPKLELNIAIFISTGATFKLLKAFWTTKILVLSYLHKIQDKKILHFERILIFHIPFIYLFMHKLLTLSSKLKTKFTLRFQTEILI